MAASINQTRVIEAPWTAVEQPEVSDGRRLARFCLLEELPGLIFGVMTVAYIVLSLAALRL